MHGWLYSCLAGVNFVESLIFQWRDESLLYICCLYDKWYPAMLLLTLVVMAYWGRHQADIRKKENIPSQLTSHCFRRFVIVAVHAEEISVNSF